MKVDFKEEGDKLLVSVTIDGRSMARDPHESVRTEQLLDIVKKNGYNLSEYTIEKESACSTEGKNPTLSATWILRKVKNEWDQIKSVKQPKKPRSTRSTRSTKPRAKPAPKEDKLLGTKDMGGVQSQAQTNLPRQDKKIPGK